MADLDEPFDPAEVAEAEALDRQIDSVLAGRAGPEVSPAVSWLVATVRVDPPSQVAARVEESHERVLRQRWRPVRYAAAAMAYLFISQGIGTAFNGEWVARGLGEGHSPHISTEGGLSMLVVGLVVLAGVFRRRLAPVSVMAGTPLALVFGVFGIGEIGTFTPGAVLHITEGIVGIVLAVTFWRYWRDTRGRTDE